MVQIAIAGASGNVAQEIIDVLVATQKHEVLLLSRKDAPTNATAVGVTWVKANYDDPKALVQTLQGVHTVLSFVSPTADPTARIQIKLIDAAVQAGVKRFAPSEWASSGLEHMSWHAWKAETRRYLEDLNKEKKILEYTLFQPGLFMNYLARPHKSSRHIHEMEMPFDFAHRRALLLDGGDDDRFTLTMVQDLANVVARAVEFEAEWPIVGGIKGTEISIGELMGLGEKIRGKSFDIEKLRAHDLETDSWKATWTPKLDHPSIPPEQVEEFSRIILAGCLLSFHAGAWSVSDEWNKLLPDYKFTQAETFLTEIWRDKP